MKKQSFVCGIFAILVLLLFVIFPSELIKGAVKGLIICADIIVPSLFPFTAISIFLFNCGFMQYIEKTMNPISRVVLGLNGSAFCVLLISFIGGFPVGAKLIDELADKKEISEHTARRMLCYCVNAGPAFVIIGIGQTLLNSKTIGLVLYISNIISSFLLCAILSFKERKERIIKTSSKVTNMSISDIFVNSVSNASSSVIGICGFIILFTALISVFSSVSNTSATDKILALLEVSNGTMLFSDNIWFLSFLTSFSGFCVHMQILTVCKHFKVRYTSFFISRLICGCLSTLITMLIIKFFKISVPVISLNYDLFNNLSGLSLPLSAALIFMAITLLISIKQNYVEKCR